MPPWKPKGAPPADEAPASPSATDKRLAARRRFRVIVALLAGAVAVYALFPSFDGPEARVRAVIDAIEVAIEAKDLGGILEHISEEYRGSDGYLGGDLTRQQLKGLLFVQFRQDRRINVQRLGSTDVELRKDGTAIARFRVRVSEGLSLSESEQSSLEVTLRDEDGDYRVTRHRRETAR